MLSGRWWCDDPTLLSIVKNVSIDVLRLITAAFGMGVEKQRNSLRKSPPALPLVLRDADARFRRFLEIRSWGTQTRGTRMFMGAAVHSTVDVEQCQEIRFRVYCQERQFLKSSDYPSETEADEFDQFATQLGVFGPASELLATARIVHHSPLGFPLQRYSDAMLPETILPTTGEVSRMAVPRAVTRRFREGEVGSPTRLISLRLYQTVYSHAKRRRLTHLVATMEPALVRICSAFDIPWRPIGSEVNYGGLVRPYLLSLAEFDGITTPAAIGFRIARGHRAIATAAESRAAL